MGIYFVDFDNNNDYNNSNIHYNNDVLLLLFLQNVAFW